MLNIIFEDNHLIAINKRSGDLAQMDQTGDFSLIEHLKNYIKIKYNKPGNVYLGSIHRLDRPTTGAIIYSKTSKSLTRMNKLFKDHKVVKIYWVLVDKMPSDDKGILTNYLRKDTTKNKSFVCQEKHTDAKLAKLEYKLVGKFGKFYLLEVQLFTGRHHQIRVQLSHIGCKIVGDLKYGFANPNSDKSICLHCRSIEFFHPIQQVPVKIIADLPNSEEWKSIK